MNDKLGKSLVVSAIFLLAYGSNYMGFRNSHMQAWEKDGQLYVVFPEENLGLYYVYRPLALVDAKLTGMRFHIGPHRE